MKTLLLASVAISSLVLGGAAFADTTVDVGAVINTQTNTSHVVSDLESNPTTQNVTQNINNINGTVTETAAAIGNSLSVTAPATNGVTNVQNQNGYVGATLNTTEYSVKGAISDTAAAIGNSATLTMSTSYGDINNTQTTNGNDPTANLTANIHDDLGAVTTTSAAIGNTFSLGGTVTKNVTAPVDVKGFITSVQTANSPDSATTNLTLDNIQNSVTSTTAAIGNSATVTANFGGSVNIDQTNSGVTTATSTVTKNLTSSTDLVTGSLSVTSAAIGNTATLTGNYDGSTATDGHVSIAQTNTGAITATLTETANGVNGSITETAAAIGNSATSTSNANLLDFIQTNNGDVSASATLTNLDIGQTGVGNKVGNVSATVAAIGNSLSVTGNSIDGSVPASPNVNQTNTATITASATVDVNSISGALTATAAAIGDSLTYVVTGTENAGLAFNQTNDGNVFSTGNFTPSNIGLNSNGNTVQNVSLTVAAIGNSLDLAGNSTSTTNITQTNNNVWTKALANVSVNEVTGNLSVTAAAIGNSASVHVK